jgi:cell fate regulator YaaT (PSP1 superfamily)
MNDQQNNIDVNINNEQNLVRNNIEHNENIRLILDLDVTDLEESAIIEFESNCPPIPEKEPEEFFYDDTIDLIEVEFKGARRAYFEKEKELQLSPMDYVIVEAEKGSDLGKVYLTGELVHIKRKGQVLRKEIIRKVIKKATQEDLNKVLENRKIEENAFLVCRKKIEQFALIMKLVDVEYQYDRNRVTFYFTSDKRIDFRELVKDLAAEYRTRIELRQIGVRDEAKMIGGISGCGRELCCCTWLNNFKKITTNIAKIQMLQLNPVKLSGQCGRLKCCLMYELDDYIESLKWFPDIEAKVITAKGDATVEKIDIFKDSLYLHYSKDDSFQKLTLREFNELYHDQFPATLVKEFKGIDEIDEDEDPFLILQDTDKITSKPYKHSNHEQHSPKHKSKDREDLKEKGDKHKDYQKKNVHNKHDHNQHKTKNNQQHKNNKTTGSSKHSNKKENQQYNKKSHDNKNQ